MDLDGNLYILLVNYDSPERYDNYLAVLNEQDGFSEPLEDVLTFDTYKEAKEFAENKDRKSVV